MSLLFGIIDFCLSRYTDSGFIGRHLTEHFRGEPRMVGGRFHGFGGEPREAFAYLALGFALYYIRNLFQGRPQNTYYYLLILVCMLLTFSTSGYIGFIIFFGLFIIHSVINHPKNLKYLLLAPLITFLLYFIITEVPRFQIHSKSLYTIVEMYYKNNIPASLVGQMSNIYPIFWIIDNLYKYNPFPLLFGGGFGSASHINNIFEGWNSISSNNPHANLTRLVSETGLIGTYVYIISFYKPMCKLASKILNNREYSRLIIFLLFVLSISLAHRSSSVFIFAGITYSYLNFLQDKK